MNASIEHATRQAVKRSQYNLTWLHDAHKSGVRSRLDAKILHADKCAAKHNTACCVVYDPYFDADNPWDCEYKVVTAKNAWDYINENCPGGRVVYSTDEN